MTRNSGGEAWSFAYGFDGLRTERSQTKNGTTTKWEYVYSGSQLVQIPCALLMMLLACR